MSRVVEIAIAFFFISHIPITIFVDSQAVFSGELYHAKIRETTEWYLRTYGDPLMTPPYKPWFLSLVYSEVFLQLPFFFVGAYAFLARRNWVRIPALMYASFVTATMLPIFFELWFHKAPGYKPAMVSAFYAPYLLFPLLIIARTAFSAYPFKQPALSDAWNNKQKWV